MLILLQISQTRKHFYASITCIRVRRPWVSLDQILCNCAECVAFDSLKHAVCEVDAWTGYNNAVFWHDHSDWFFHCCLAVIFEILIYISAQLPYIQQIVEADIPCITTNPRVECEGTGSVDADPYEQAKVNCELALKKIPKNAKVVVLQGPAGNFHSTKRREAWKKEFFDKRSDVKILAEDIANWNKDEAMQLMEDWVQAYGQIDAVISMNDNMAAGAIEAVKDNAKYKNMQAYGVDGTAEACLLIKEGKMTSTGLQSAIDLAKMNTEAMHDVLTGKKKVTDINDNVPAPLITSDNVDEYIQMYKDNGQIKK